jgi:hypothetical protein
MIGYSVLPETAYDNAISLERIEELEKILDQFKPGIEKTLELQISGKNARTKKMMRDFTVEYSFDESYIKLDVNCRDFTNHKLTLAWKLKEDDLYHLQTLVSKGDEDLFHYLVRVGNTTVVTRD